MIESQQNGKVKHWSKLKRRKDRMKSNTFLIEGEHLIEEALKSNWIVKELIVLENYNTDWLQQEKVVTTVVSDKIFATLANTENPQGIMAEIEMREEKIQPHFQKVIMLDAIQDPGNAGTIVRTADALGFDAVLFGKGTVDLYNEKVIRATQGSLFHIPVITGDLEDWVYTLKKDGFIVWATALENAQRLEENKPPEKVAVLFGNEGSGVQQELLQLADHRVYIPIKGQAESLNVSIASGIIMYYLQQ
ncbi:TrmH family RNA methyltransferase [Salirhabdus euzebyi]|uniref:TrmH family RNA methyltransferase n=1 Tax=Salirhabdus euzebyi TaxID=394506 RepID=A0A841Q1G5_9BACI|nr:RNA methyltransferase [Salirhabdus euzebyi]MBB6452053.1 TrmH family RNA methyltransferase [Salirhabdus euzebyi]